MIIQTGLPDGYINKDRETLRNHFGGRHNFQIKVGNKQWQAVSLNIERDDVYIVIQPFSTLFSLTVSKYGEMNNIDLLEQNILILDLGFRTTDTLLYKPNLELPEANTWEDLPMLKVIHNIKRKVNQDTNGQGYFHYYFFDRILIGQRGPGEIIYGRRQIYDISEAFFNSMEEICENTLKQIDISKLINA